MSYLPVIDIVPAHESSAPTHEEVETSVKSSVTHVQMLPCFSAAYKLAGNTRHLDSRLVDVTVQTVQ